MSTQSDVWDTLQTNGGGLNGRARELQPRVDVVIPVFNALHDVKQCFAALLGHDSGTELRLIVVNDGSNEQTTSWLRERSSADPQIDLIEHPENLGYTRAANTGLRASTAPYVVILNSDTIVTKGWLQRMLECAESSPRIGIVGPLSNAASWQSVPRVKDQTGFVINALPPGVTPDDMAAIVASTSKREYPRSTFINGFCFFIRRSVIETIGMFDELAFPQGYGEENDYCIRAQKAGFELAIANHAYVYHAKSKSFGHGRRKELSAKGAKVIRDKHGEQEVSRLIAQVQVQPELDAQRLLIQDQLPESPKKSVASDHPVDPLSLRILFLLPTKGGGGGAHSVVQEAAAMRRLGVDAKVAVRPQDLSKYLRKYSEIPDSNSLFLPYAFHDVTASAEGYDVVVATIYSSVQRLAEIVHAHPEVVPAYYVQDYEPLFFDEDTEEHHVARESYTAIPDAALFAKTDWLVRTVAEKHAIPVHKVEPSLDHAVYRPRARTDRDDLVRIAAMVRPQTRRRGAARTMRVLREISRRFSERVTIDIFGCDGADAHFLELDQDFPHRNHGQLDRSEVAELLAQTDIFIDLSDYQAFGRTALEAMACGCATIVPAQGGADEYAVHGRNALVVDTSDEAACVEQLAALVSDPKLVARLRMESLKTASEYSVHRAAVSELNFFAEAIPRYRARHPFTPRPRLTLLTGREKGGAIAASGYVRLAYPWQSRSVRRSWSTTVSDGRKLPAPGSAQLFVVQGQSLHLDLERLAHWLGTFRAKGGKLVFEIDDDLLDLPTLEKRNYAQPKAVVERVRWLASVADAVFVSTDTLQADYLALNPNVLLVPNFLDAQLWRLGLPAITDPQYLRQPDDPVRIGYIGTPTHDSDLKLLTPVVERLQEEYGSRIAFEIVGAFQKRPPPWGQRIDLPKNHSYPAFVSWLQRRINWDIGMIPLKDNRFGRRKSPLKFLEYSALRLPSVCSDVHTYRRTVRNGYTGLLVPNEPEAWYAALKQLIEHPDQRTRLAEAAYSDVTENYSTEANSRVYLDALDRILAQPPRTDTGQLESSWPRAIVTPTPEKKRRPDSPSTSASDTPEQRGTIAMTPGGPTKLPPQPATAELPTPPPRTEVWRRKIEKLRRDPSQFVADSSLPGMKLASRILRLK